MNDFRKMVNRFLEKNGFSFVEKMENYMEVNGKSVDSLSYVKFLGRSPV